MVLGTATEEDPPRGVRLPKEKGGNLYQCQGFNILYLLAIFKGCQIANLSLAT
jgi:hypothetical protein